MKRILLLIAVLLHFASPSYAMIAFKSGERADGFYKYCFYDKAGQTVSIRISAAELCPLSIDA